MSENLDKKQQAKTNDIPKPKKKTPAQIAKEVEVLERGKRVIELKKAGASFRAIAEKMKDEGIADVSHETVRQDYLAAMSVLSKDYRDEAILLKDLQNQRLETLLMAHWTPALGKTYIEVNPQTGQPIIDDKTGQAKKVVIPPDAEAGRLALKTIHEISELNQLLPKQTQISGKGGGPVETTIVSLTVEEWRKQVQERREQVAKTRELYQREEE